MQKAPYYIFAPNFLSTSAGVKALYILCDRINKIGYSAYIVSSSITTNFYSAPILNFRTFFRHIISGVTPIVVYPEVIEGNPLKANFYVRYYFCFNGQFGVDLRSDKPNLIYAFSQDICDDAVKTNNIMFIPTLDLSVFHPYKESKEREGFCYAALKYKYFHGEEIFGLLEGGVEITRNLPDSQTKEEIAALFRKCKYFYCFDNSALALEATLCGCTTILMKNKYFTKLIGETELNGLPGMAWNDDIVAIAKAEEQIENAYENYLSVVKDFDRKIEVFIEGTQNAIMDCPIRYKLVMFHMFYMFFILRMNVFTKTIFRKTYHKIIWLFPSVRKFLLKTVFLLRKLK